MSTRYHQLPWAALRAWSVISPSSACIRPMPYRDPTFPPKPPAQPVVGSKHDLEELARCDQIMLKTSNYGKGFGQGTMLVPSRSSAVIRNLSNTRQTSAFKQAPSSSSTHRMTTETYTRTRYPDKFVNKLCCLRTVPICTQSCLLSARSARCPICPS